MIRRTLNLLLLSGALLACLLGVRSSGRASVARALLEGAGLYGLLFVLGMVTRSLALNGHLAPWVSAWLLPALLLLVAGDRAVGKNRLRI